MINLKFFNNIFLFAALLRLTSRILNKFEFWTLYEHNQIFEELFLDSGKNRWVLLQSELLHHHSKQERKSVFSKPLQET